MLIDLPSKLIYETIKSELSCIAFNKTNNSLVHIRTFGSDENGQIVAEVDHYPMEENEKFIEKFDVSVMGGPLLIADTSNVERDYKSLASLLTQLYNFMDNHSCVHSHDLMSPKDVIRPVEDKNTPREGDIEMDLEDIPQFEGETQHEV